MKTFNLVKSLRNLVTNRKGLLILCLSLAVLGTGEVWGGEVEITNNTSTYTKKDQKSTTFYFPSDDGYTFSNDKPISRVKFKMKHDLTTSDMRVDVQYKTASQGYTTKWKDANIGKSGEKTIEYSISGEKIIATGIRVYVKATNTSKKDYSIWDFYIYCYSDAVTFDANGGNGTTTVTEYYNGNYTLPSNPTRDGYTFAGWWTEANGGTQVTTSTMVTRKDDHTLYARWTAISYNVQYNANGGSGSMSNQSFKFDEQKSLTANSLTNSYTISFDGNGGSTPSEISSTRSFEGWEDRGSIVYNGIEYKYTDFDAPYYANTYGDLFTAFGYNKYNLLNHYVNNGSGEGRSCKGDTPGLYPNQTSVANLSTTNGATIPLYAHWSVNGAAITLPSASKNNSVLVGWYNGDNFVGEPGDSYTPSGDVTLIAHWASKYDITVTGSDQSMKVGDAQENAFNFVHAENPTPKISIISIDPINNGDGQVIEYDATNNKIIAHNAGTATICFEQAGTSTMNAGTSATFTFTISKIANTLTADATHSMKVEETWMSVISGKNSDAMVTTTTSDETVAYYDVASNKIVAQNTGNQSFNSKEVTITISQAETYKYTAASKTIKVMVNKWDNHIFINNSQDSYAASIYMDAQQSINLTATNTDYSGSPITATQTAGNTIAALNAAQTQVTSNHNLGDATWNVSQPENYKYKAANASFAISVVQQAEATDCYVLNDPNEYSASTHIYSFEGVSIHTYTINKPYSHIWFDAYTTGTEGHYFIQYSTDNGSNYSDLANPNVSGSYKPFDYDLPKNTTNIRFYAKTGATGTHYVKNVRVTRKTYLEASDFTIDTQENNTTRVYPGDKGTGSFHVDYSLANGGDLKIVCDNPKFTIDKTTQIDVDCKSGSFDVKMTYTSQTAGTDYAHVIIYNNVYRKEITVTGITQKHQQTLNWKANFDQMSKGSEEKNAATSSHGLVTYISSEPGVIRVDNDANGNATILVAIAKGEAKITATAAGDDEYEEISIEKTISVTEKCVQYIVWTQSLMGLKFGDPNRVLNAYATSEIEECTSNNGGRLVTYTSADESVVKVVNTNQLQIVGVGTTTVTARQAGGLDSDGHEYEPAAKENTVVVKDPSAKCESFVYEQGEQAEEFFSMEFTTPELKGTEHTLNGEPAELTFRAKREYWKLGINYSKGNIVVDAYTPTGDWQQVLDCGEPPIGSYEKYSINLNRDVTKIRFRRPQGGQGYHYIADAKIEKARYIETSTPATFQANVGEVQQQTIYLSYSNITDHLLLSMAGGVNSHFSVDKTQIPGNCGDVDKNIALTISYAPTTNTEELGEETETLIISDGTTITNVALKGVANRVARSIAWNINDQNTAYTVQTIELNAIAETNLHQKAGMVAYNIVSQTSTEGCGTINNNVLSFTKAGNVSVVATTIEDPKYFPATAVTKSWTVSKTPTMVTTKPSISTPIVSGSINLSDIVLEGGAAQNTINNQAVAGTFAVTAGDLVNVGEQTLTITFTPNNTDMYEGCTTTITATIVPRTPTIKEIGTPSATAIVYGNAVNTSALSGNGTLDGTWSWTDTRKNETLPAGTYDDLAVHFTPDNKNYTEADATVSLTVYRATPTLTWTSAPTEADVKAHLTYTATSNHTESEITYSITAGADCATIDASTGVLTITKAGTITVQASQAASNNYEAAVLSQTTILTGEFENRFTGDGDWNNAGNWTNGIPTEENPNVVISGSLTITEPISVGGLTIENNGKVTVIGDGDLTINGTSDDRETYGNLFVRNGGNITINENANVKVYDFVVESSIGTEGTSISGQVKNSDRVLYTNGAYIDINMDPSGKMDDTQWYAFTVPFPVDVQNGVARKEGDVFRKCTYGVEYMICEYDINQRLNTGKGWKYIKSGQLQPGRFYYFTVNGNNNVYSFKAAENTITINNTTELRVNGEGADANWNAVGNSTLTYTTISGEKVPAYVQTYVNGESRYITVHTTEAQFVVGCPFFFQASETATMILNEANETVDAHYAPRQESLDKPVCVRIAEEGKHFSDQIYLTASQEATSEYTLGRDLAKAGIGTKSAQLWMNAYGQKLSVQDATLMGDQAYYELSIYAPKAGSYELSLSKVPVDATIFLIQNGYPIWNLNESPYVIECNKGTSNEYGLLLQLQESSTPTNMQTMRGSENVQKILKDQRIYINANTQLYDLMGQKVK